LDEKSKRIGGECNTHGREELHGGFWCGNMRERDHMEDSGVDGSFISRWICGLWDEGMD